MRRQLEAAADVITAHRQQRIHVRHGEHSARVVQGHAVADEQQPDEDCEWIVVTAESGSRGRLLVPSERCDRGSTDSPDNAIDRVRRTAQRVGDALRRFGVQERERQGTDAVSTAGFSLPKPTARRLLMTTAATIRPSETTPTMMRTALF